MLTSAKELKRSALVFPSTYTHRTVPLLRLLITLILLLHHCDGTVHQHGAAFAEEVACWLRAESLFVTPFNVPWLPRSALMVGRAGLQPCMALHLLPTPQSPAEVLSSSANVDASDEWETRNVAGPPLVHLWQDEWMEKSDIVRSRLLAMTGKSERIMARKTFVRRINAATLENFLQENHLWGPTQARFRYGLFRKRGIPSLDLGAGGCQHESHEAMEHLVAVASFSPRRHVDRCGVRFRSHELIRYCSKRGTSVVGGISKLMAAFERELEPDDVITVVDRNWGAGDGWGSLGFKALQKMPPATFYIGPDGKRCHAMGTGRNPYRRQIPVELMTEFRSRANDVSSMEELSQFLADQGFYRVHDAGARRLVLLRRELPDSNAFANSSPKYPSEYYLSNPL